jgi:beta propeller repeat protein
MKQAAISVIIAVLIGLIACTPDATSEISPVSVTPPTPALNTGVLEGKVSIGPRSPEEIGQPYAPEIYQPRKVMVYDADHAKLIRQVDLDENGYYSVELSPGTYTIDINYFETDRGESVPRKLKIEPGMHYMFDIDFNTGMAAGSWKIGENLYFGQQSVWGNTLACLELIYKDGKLTSQALSTYNLITREKKQVLQIPDSRMADTPSIYKDKIVFASVDGDEYFKWGISSSIKPPPNYDVFLLDLDTGEVKQLTTEEHAQMSPRIYGDTVVWLDARNQPLNSYPPPFDIYTLDLKTNKETRITANTTAEGYDQIAISGNLIAWADMRYADMSVASHASNDAVYNNEIYVYDLATNQERRITTSLQNDRTPDIDGNLIIWLRQEDHLKADVFLYDLESGQETQVSHSSYADSNPSIYGERIVWADARSSQGNTNNDVVINGQEPGADIYLYDLKTQKESQLTTAEAWQLWLWPVIHGNHVVYVWNQQTGGAIYALDIP